jgi:hypothetical protein
MTNGWPAPASQKLGANWVEVTVWGRMKMRFNQGPKRFENVASNNPVDFVPAPDDEQAMVFQVGVAFPELKENGRDGPAIRGRFSISNCRLPILRSANRQESIGSRQSEIGQ